MRKTIKKLTAVGLTLTSVMGLVACGNNNASTENKATVDWASVEKPESFTVMVDGTVPQMEEWGDKFDEQLKQLTELDFEVVRPDHNSYYDAVANSMLDASAMPDVIILSSDYLALYASQGLLWDMTDAMLEALMAKRLFMVLFLLVVTDVLHMLRKLGQQQQVTALMN